ncbi:MAG: HAD family hydrolase, partial [Candidatus Binataceae bacterium]
MKAAILFDFGGTLDRPAHWLDRFLVHYQAAGIALERPRLDVAFSHATASAYHASGRMRSLNLEQTVSYLVDLQIERLIEDDHRIHAALDAAGGRERVVAAITRSFTAESQIGLATSAPILRRLATRFRLGVISNFYGNLEQILDDAGLLPIIETVADSSRLGIFKPDPRIFQAALNAMAIEPEAALMVGDSLSKDCEPAHALGMTTVWLRHRPLIGDEFFHKPSGHADFTIDALAELEHL